VFDDMCNVKDVAIVGRDFGIVGKEKMSACWASGIGLAEVAGISLLLLYVSTASSWVAR
jgi:hypothetical protein